MQKNTKKKLQNPFNQFFKILLYNSYRQVALLCKLTLFTGTFYSQASTGLEIKLVLDELIDFSIWLNYLGELIHRFRYCIIAALPIHLYLYIP